MSSRTSDALLFVTLLASCAPSRPAGRVACAHGDSPLVPNCAIERGMDGYLTLRFPDGGFRRLRIVGDRRGVVAADGADAARVSPAGTGREIGIEVRVGSDRFRLPAHLETEASR